MARIMSARSSPRLVPGRLGRVPRTVVRCRRARPRASPVTPRPAGACGPSRATARSQLTAGARTAAAEGEAGPHRRVLRRRLDRTPLGRDRLPGPAGPLEEDVLRLERRRLRLGRRRNAEHPVADRARRTRRRQPEGDRHPRRHQQRRHACQAVRAKVAEISRGVLAIVQACRLEAPAATIILTAIFPRNDSMAVMPEIRAVNENLSRLADGRMVRFLDVNARTRRRRGAPASQA